jgi:hypothetical protein
MSECRRASRRIGKLRSNWQTGRKSAQRDKFYLTDARLLPIIKVFQSYLV